MDSHFETRSGRTLTDADIEALADEAEKGYDVEHLNTPEQAKLGTARAHARHLRTLVEKGREHLARGEKIPDELWDRLEEISGAMIEALSRSAN